MTQDERRELFAALHVALDQLEERGADPSPIAGAAACLGDDVRAALAAVGWAAEPLDEAALTARLAALAREAKGDPGLDPVWSTETTPHGWRVADADGKTYTHACDTHAYAWSVALSWFACRHEFTHERSVAAEETGEDGWERRQG